MSDCLDLSHLDEKWFGENRREAMKSRNIEASIKATKTWLDA